MKINKFQFDILFEQIINEEESLGTLNSKDSVTLSSSTSSPSATVDKKEEKESDSKDIKKTMDVNKDFFNLLKNVVDSNNLIDAKKAESLIQTLSKSAKLTEVPQNKLQPTDKGKKQIFNFNGGQLVFTNQQGKYKVEIIPTIKTDQTGIKPNQPTPDSDAALKKLIDSMTL